MCHKEYRHLETCSEMKRVALLRRCIFSLLSPAPTCWECDFQLHVHFDRSTPKKPIYVYTIYIYSHMNIYMNIYFLTPPAYYNRILYELYIVIFIGIVKALFYYKRKATISELFR